MVIYIRFIQIELNQFYLNKIKESSRLKLILCGSYIDVMRSLLARDNPLFGRVDLTLDLKPMDYYDSARFYPSFSDEDKVRLFSVFGGIPYYNQFIDESFTVRENIMELIAAPGARFENEAHHARSAPPPAIPTSASSLFAHCP